MTSLVELEIRKADSPAKNFQTTIDIVVEILRNNVFLVKTEDMSRTFVTFHQWFNEWMNLH